jgi:muramidase (phage lysozyme)
MAQYKRSASRSGFVQYTLPDEARAFEEEQRRRQLDLKQAFQLKQKNDQASIEMQTLEQRFLDRADTRQESLDQTYRRAYKESLKQNFKVEQANLKRQQEQRSSVTDRLSQFSQTLLKEAGEEFKKRNEREKEFGKKLAYEFGVDFEDLKALKTIEDNLKAENAANNAVVRKLQARGASPDQINAIRQLDGWRLYGAEISIAEQGKYEYSNFLSNPEVRDRVVRLGDGSELTLNQATENLQSDSYEEIKAILRSEFLRDNYDTLSQPFADKYLYPGMREVDSYDRADYDKKTREIFKNNEDAEYKNAVGNLAINGQSAQEFILEQTGGLKGPAAAIERDKLLKTVTELASNGVFSSKARDNLLGSKWIQDGNEKSFAEQFKNSASVQELFNEIDFAIIDYEKKVAKADTFQRNQQWEAILEEATNAYVANNGVLDAEQEQRLVRIQKEQFPDKQFNATVQAGLDRDLSYFQPELFRERMLEQLTYTGTIDPEDLERAAQTEPEFVRGLIGGQGSISNKLGIDDLAKSVVSDLVSFNPAGTVKKTNVIETAKSSLSFNVMVSRTKSYFTSKYLQPALRLMAPDDNLLDVVTAAKMRFQEDLIKGDKPDFQQVPDPITEGAFVYKFLQTENPEFTRQEAITGLQKRSEQDNEFILSKPDLSIPERSAIKSAVQSAVRNNGRFPDWFTKFYASAKPGPDIEKPQTMLEFAQQLIEYYNLGVDAEGKEDTTITAIKDIPINPFTTVAPSIELKKQLDRVDVVTASNSRVITSEARRAGATGMQAYRPMLDAIASVESSNDTQFNGYDAMNTRSTPNDYGTTTGSQAFNRPLIEMTVGEIREAQNNGQLYAAGRYQFIGSTLDDIFDRDLAPGINDDSLFDRATQDKLAIAYIQSTVSEYKNTNGDVIKGLGHRFHGLQNLPRTQLESLVNQWQGATAGTAFEGVVVKPDVLRSYSRSRTGAFVYKDERQSYIAAGKAFESAGFRVGEQSDFDPVDGDHAPNSYHNYNEAFDITHQKGDRKTSIAKTKRLKEVIRNFDPPLFDEIIGPGDYEEGRWKDRSHDTHLHLGGLLREITQDDIDAINSVN